MLHHVFLFPQLPQKDDDNANYDLLLNETVINALKKFKLHVSKQNGEILGVLITMLVRLRTTLGVRGEIDEVKLKSVLRALDTDDGTSVSFSFESPSYLLFVFREYCAHPRPLPECCRSDYSREGHNTCRDV